MAIELPQLPVGTQTAFGLKTNAKLLTPTMGGVSQRVASGGDKWSVSIQSQPLDIVEGSSFIGLLIQGLTDRVRYPFRLDGFDLSGVGTPLVANGSSGRSLSISGAPPGHLYRRGQFLNVVHAGVKYLHQLTADTTVSGGGTATLAIYPMLRVAPFVNDEVDFATPVIEGFLDGDSQGWSVGMVRNVGLSFSIVEAQ